jgi:hypothetical protein
MSHQYSVETYLFICHNIYTIDSGHQWLRAVILAPQGTEIRRVAVSSQAPANSSKRAGRVAQVLRVGMCLIRMRHRVQTPVLPKKKK